MVKYFIQKYFIFIHVQGDFFQFESGTGVLQSLYWDLRGPHGLQSAHKNGRKLLLGKKHTRIGI